MSGYLDGLLALLCIDVMFAYGVFLPVMTGQLNLGGAGFQALGGYVAAWLAATYDVAPWATLPLGALAGGLAGLLIALPLARVRGVYLVLATIAFGQLVTGLILASPTLGGAQGIPVPSFVGLAVIVPLTLAVMLGCFYLCSTRLGLAMRAVHDDEAVADLMGVSARAMQVTSYAIGGAIVGLSGALYAHQFGFVQAQGFDETLSVYVLLYVLLGGVQTAWGPLIGTACFVLIPELLRNLLPRLSALLAASLGLPLGDVRIDDSWRLVILGAFTVAMMILRPQGIVTRTMIDRLLHSPRARRAA
jgi:branched-chain amino acid transport system permease protein